MPNRFFAALALACLLATPALAKTSHGKASWYGGGEKLNRHTANGEVFRPDNFEDLTCAHRTFRFGTRVRVTHAKSGRSIVCRVNDRGPAAWTGRVIDLSRAAGARLGIIAAGEAPVRLEVIR